MKKITFNGYNIHYKVYKTEGVGTDIVIEISDDQLDAVSDILLKKLPKGNYKITIEPNLEEK